MNAPKVGRPKAIGPQAISRATSDMSWQASGICIDDPDWHRLSKSEQVHICTNCPVREECLAYALLHAGQDDSVWGGKTRSQRMGLRRRALKAAREAVTA